MSDLRRDQIAAAGEVFERVLRGYADPAAPAGGVKTAQLRTAAARTVDLYAQLVQEALEGVMHLAEDLAPSIGGGEPPLALSGRPGAAAATPIFLHNATDAAVERVVLRLTDLTAPSGAVIAGALADLEPDRLDLAPGASAETRLSLRIPHHAPAGIYHGHLLAHALPDAALAVRLEVAP